MLKLDDLMDTVLNPSYFGYLQCMCNEAKLWPDLEHLFPHILNI